MESTRLTIGRRQMLARLLGTAALAVPASTWASAWAPAWASASAGPRFSRMTLRGGHDADLAGLLPGTADDQSRALQRAIDAAAAADRILRLPAGSYTVSNIVLPEGTRIRGVAGATRLVYGGRGHGLLAEGVGRIELSDLVIDGANQRLGEHVSGLVHLRGVGEAILEGVSISGSSRNGLTLSGCGGRVDACDITGAADAGLFAVDSTGLSIRDNVVADCADGGILVHRWQAGADGTMVTGNRVMRIGARSGGTGQNGNGINIFRAGNVMVSNNRVSDCAFSAIRANSAGNIQITDNQAFGCGETAIYSEFAFEGAVISGNSVDEAANGISVANFNRGGRLAVVSGNLIRNLSATGPYAPHNAGFGIGIAVEADASVTGNVIEGAPQWGVLAGWGPFLRDVAITGNTIREAGAGVAVSVVEGAGPVLISGNIFSATRRGGVVGTRWREIVTGDLALTGAAAFPHLTVDHNAVG